MKNMIFYHEEHEEVNFTGIYRMHRIKCKDAT